MSLFIKNYLNRNKIKPLKKEEAYELIVKARAGDKVAKDKLIVHNMPYVLNITNRYHFAENALLGFEDLFQEGVIGLIRGIELFDMSRNLELSTYIDLWIKQRIRRYIQDNRGPVRVPGYLQDLKAKYKRLKDEASPQDDDFYLRLVAHQNEKTVSTLRRAISNVPTEMNIDDPLNTTPLESIVDETQMSVDQLDAQALLGMLNEQERVILERRMTNWTLLELAQEIGLSRERVRQLEEAAIFKLKVMVGNVKDNKVFEMRELLKVDFKAHKEALKVLTDSRLPINRIYAACQDCFDRALELRENATKRRMNIPSWLKAECDVCYQIKAVASVKTFEFPMFEKESDVPGND